ncbi:protein FAM83F [Thalassophryne amazonica]|uniref:protein FAM83F n=1 Tax=Thalassophryne amazonica TaxID=390379 RepID=UPI0014708F41|nr:protein FAM83F [Thalassophryne amazonica]XP_034047052.1 protein FAM83F [Thalassophryne amazonica]
MAESQLLCLDDEHVNEKIPESRPEFYYSEEQRAALEQLVRRGADAFQCRLKADNIKDFLSPRELKTIRKTFREYDTDSDSDPGEQDRCKESSADSGRSTYWPQMSDTEVPSLDIGWSGSSGVYKGVTRVSVYTHPPKEPGPHIKEVVRKLIQEAHKVLAIVMDLLTDLQILQDLLDASSRRGVAVYAVLEAKGVAHFLNMCARLQVNAVHLRNLRVRMVKGAGLALSFGKLPGSLSSKYMLVDGEKVMFGSYSFTWISSRMDRNTITVMSGQIVDIFDSDFRELYAVSEQVDLYKEFNLTKPPKSSPVKRPPVKKAQPQPLPTSMSRFQVSVTESRQMDLKIPAHKYHNPKYSLVFGNTIGLTGSLQDLSSVGGSRLGGINNKSGLHNGVLHAKRDSREKLDQVGPQSPPSPEEEGEGDGKGGLKRNQSTKKQRSSFRHFLKGRGANQGPEIIDEGVVTPRNPSPNCKISESNGVPASELEDSFESNDKITPLKFKIKKPSKQMQRSVSLQTISTEDEDGFKGRRRQKKNCIQS